MDKLTEEQMDEIAERAAEKTVKKWRDGIYQEVGKNVLSKFLYIIGACAIGVFLYFEKFSH
tara:strand:+ start:316 stop:498 length:183 start_codon:yes stop_codon:yes gene_type:complete